MIRAAANINEVWGSLLVDELYRQGCRLICISPGSRSTPLTVAAARHPDMDTHIATDERAAAFFALGYGRVTGRPAALFCTSGTAAANYYPAVIEASVDYVPMLICSADRPPELLDTQANQTIRQSSLFGDYVRWHSVLPCPTEHVPASAVLTTVGQAWHRATRSPAGPVHLNCMFREPLAPTPDFYDPEYLNTIESWLNGRFPWTHYHPTQGVSSPPVAAGLSQVIQKCKRGVLVVGRRPTHASSASILELAKRLGWPVFTDIASGLRFSKELDELRVPAHDTLFRDEFLAQAAVPDCVLHLGGPLVSKWFPRWMALHSHSFYAVVASHPNRMDPSHCVTQRLEASPEDFAEQLLSYLPEFLDADPRWLQLWADCAKTTKSTIDHEMKESVGFPEPKVAKTLSEQLPQQHTLFIGNSMPIRDWDLFASTGPDVGVVANRGASGIDGLLASALGAVRGSGQAGTLVIGDLSLMHDLGSLLMWKQSGLPLVVVVLNNQGGGIFGMLPISKVEDVFEPYFVTPHSFALAPIAASMGIKTFQSSSEQEFVQHYNDALASGIPCLVEVATDREENKAFHVKFSRLVANKAKEALASLGTL